MRRQDLKEIWNSPGMRRLRNDMLSGRPSPYCADCYEWERSGLFSARLRANKDYAAHRSRASATNPDGSVDSFRLVYLDIRFSNECNFRCRICGPWLSTAWYAESPGSGARKALRPSDDPESLWRQIEPHLAELEEVYFAGGEPLIMKEHYRLLDALSRRGLFHVRLRYSTNFSQTSLGDDDVLRLWARFHDVSVAASLDGSGRRGEYLRKGQRWERTVENRRRMMKECPQAKFLLSPTLCVMNALHLPDFHGEWLEAGLSEPEDFHLNMLLRPEEYRINILPGNYKTDVERKYGEHVERLRRRWGERAVRPIEAFEGALRFLRAEEKEDLLLRFRAKTLRLDEDRGESFREIFPELAGLMG